MCWRSAPKCRRRSYPACFPGTGSRPTRKPPLDFASEPESNAIRGAWRMLTKNTVNIFFRCSSHRFYKRTESAHAELGQNLPGQPTIENCILSH